MNKFLNSAILLHTHLNNKHWDGKAIIGPDPIGRINWRINRFVKSYIPWSPWFDQYVFLQGQGYWLQSNLKLAKLTNKIVYLDIARANADYIIEYQRDDGSWRYPPLFERRHFIATVEGVWASIGLIDAYRQFKDERYLEAVYKWYDFQINSIGFVKYEDSLAINYYDKPVGMVPNNTTLLLRMLAEAYDVTKDKIFLEYTEPMIRFLQYSQLNTGMFPYAFKVRKHLLCYQYNSFEFLDLAYYFDLTQDERIKQILRRLTKFLSAGFTSHWSSKYDFFKDDPEVNYYTAVLATALHKATQLQLGQFEEISKKGYEHLLTQQNKDGSFYFSRRNYKILKDTRSYPRYLAMILNHLLLKADE